MWKYTSKYDCNEFLLSLNLLNVKNKKKYLKILYSIANSKEKNYKIIKIKKRNGKYRTIYEPDPILKSIQRRILSNILEERNVSKYSKAYYKGISLKDNAIPHVNKKIILKLDIENFFPNITFMNVYNACFPMELYPKQVGMLLTYLCTINDYVPQGAPTSSYISNLVMRDFDNEIGSFCEERNIDYTRYSDDMTFSGDFNVYEIIVKVRKMLGKLGLNINNDKIHVAKNSREQNVTGLIVNEKVQVSKKYRRKIRQEIYYIKKYGILEHMKRNNINDKNKYLNSLYGKINYVLQINNEDKEFVKYKEIVSELKKIND